MRLFIYTLSTLFAHAQFAVCVPGPGHNTVHRLCRHLPLSTVLAFGLPNSEEVGASSILSTSLGGRRNVVVWLRETFFDGRAATPTV